MIETVAQFEFPTVAWPAIGDVSGDMLATVWQRIEHYTACRFTARTVTWLLESGGGEWVAPLRPVVSIAARRWTGDGYQVVALAPAPGGWTIPAGRYEIEATVGAGPVPAAVATAAKRLAEYLMAVSVAPAGARVYETKIGDLSESVTLDPAARARALQNSGAADLLRPYRRV